MIGTLCLMLVILAAFILLFFLVDLYLKNDKSTTTPKQEKPVEKPASPTPPKQDIELAPKPQIKEEKSPTIYNNNLADELDEILKNTPTEDETRIKAGRHVNPKSNVAKYLAAKNYQPFDFTPEAVDKGETPETDDKTTFTKEDYKRIVLLSNIKDKK